MRTRSLVACLLSMSISTLAAQDFQMLPASSFDDDSEEPFIIGGRKADAAMWPATFQFKGVRNSPCTATVIGPRVVLTAAHCVGDASSGVLQRSGSHNLQCFHHPSYDAVPEEHPQWEQRTSPDLALCISDTPVSGVPPEHLLSEHAAVRLNGFARLQGFGCTIFGGSSGTSGPLYEGDARIIEVPMQAGLKYFTLTSNGAAVCAGDSGGGAFIVVSETPSQRWLFGVASRGTAAGVSYVATVTMDGFKDWAKEFGEDHNVEICGFAGDGDQCPR